MQIKKHYKIELAKTLNQHWYSVWDGDKFLGHFPSSTTILNAYPQSVQLTKWIADNGWSESQRIKSEAGERGTRIHNACDYLEDGLELYENDYKIEEWVKIKSFVEWHKKYSPELIAKEFPIFSKKGKYAGRLDRIYKIDDEIVIVDFKSSSSLHEHFPLQFASYANAIEEMTDLKVDKTAGLLLGASNKDGYRFVEYPEWKDHYKVFQNVYKTWQYENFGSKVRPKDAPILELPDSLKL